MKPHQLFLSAVLIAALLGLFPQPAAAYVGPGAGLSAIGVFLAIFAGIIVALFGFVWYPLKRLYRMFKKPHNNQEGSQKDGGGEGGTTP